VITLDERAILKAVCDAPDDDFPRMAYADWCEENGRPRRAEFVRIQLMMAKGAEGCSCGACVRRLGGGQQTNGPCAMSQVRVPIGGKMKRADWRCHELCAEVGGWPTFMTGWPPTICNITLSYSDLRRGFIDSITCGVDWWMIYGPELVRNAPLTWIDATDRAPSSQGGWFREGTAGVLGGACELPGPIFALVGKEARSRAAAMKALSDACLKWARTERKETA
jgi:uncharacterized protein (TIGR02996 family)